MELKEKRNVYFALISYLAIIFLIASFITIGVAVVYSIINQVDLYKIYESFLLTDFTSLTPEIAKASAITQAYGNLISYIIVTVLVIIFLRNYICEDAKVIKENKKLIGYSIIAGIIFIILSLIVELIVALLAPISQNQNSIELIMNNGGKIPMLIAVVFLAPVVEELVYRKCIFKIFGSSGKTACYVASILLFTLPHVITSDMSNLIIWLIQCVPYAFCGFMLSYIYDKSNENIYSVIIVHMMNNLFAAIMIVIGG